MPLAVTSPDASTETTIESDDDHDAVRPSTGLSLESDADATNRTVSWRARIVSTADCTRTTVTTWRTVTEALPECPLAEARTVVTPLARAVANPVAVTRTTASSAEVQAKLTPDTWPPAPSRAIAVNCAVDPSASSAAVLGETVIDATWRVSGAVPPSPQSAASAPATIVLTTRRSLTTVLDPVTRASAIAITPEPPPGG
jgi:hypothetical protein